jgi:hypothetical protein
MDRPRFEHRPAGHPLAVERLSFTERNADRSGVRTRHDYVAVAEHDSRIQRLAQASRARNHRVQHRLNVGWRAAYHAQDVGRGGLLFQRFRQIIRALAQFVEQPRILDGDDGLAGEACHQLDLLIGEGTNFLTEDGDGPNQVIILEHRHNDHGPNATKLDGVDDRWMALGIRSCRCKIGGLNRLLGSDQLVKVATRGRTQRTASARLGKCPRHIVAGDDA